MALSFDVSEESASIEVHEFIEVADRTIDVYDQDSITAMARDLKKLSNNRKFLTDKFIHQITEFPAIDKSFYTNQSAVIAASKKVTIRCNIWPKIALPDERRRDAYLAMYGYDNAHDHNFPLLTVGYFGPGYRTRVWEYDRSMVEGYIGESVELTELGETSLPQGEVMFYRPFVDVHQQIPPEDYSMSLNMIVNNPDVSNLHDQFEFDTEKGVISSYIETGNGRRVSQFDIISMMGTDNHIEPLAEIARTHSCGRTRVAARRAILAIRPDQLDTVVREAELDHHPLAKRFLESLSEGLGR